MHRDNSMMESELKRIAAHPGLCKDVHEIVQASAQFFRLKNSDRMNKDRQGVNCVLLIL